jgi:gliding motility-associated-like protein
MPFGKFYVKQMLKFTNFAVNISHCVKLLLNIFSKTIGVSIPLLLFSANVMAQCSGTQSLTANPAPLPGNTYNPGTVVTFCYTMVGYNEVGANWVDGFDLNIGAGWAPGSLTPVSPPANCGGGGGQWVWANSVTGQFSGATWGPGYFFDLNPDGNPGNDFGDQNAANCTWTFCFSLTAGNTPGASLSVTVEALSDGETGSWGSTACNGTPFTLSTATVSNNPGTVYVTSNSSVCAGSSVTLTAVGATNYTWSPATGLNTTTGATVVATPASTTTYTVTGSGGCTTCTATTTVTVNPIPNVSVTPAAPSICSGQSTTLTASGATTYTWSPATGLNTTNGATVTANPATTTTYTVTGTAAGCTDPATVTVTVNPIPVVTISPTPPTICAGQSIAITANGAVSYSWSPATGLSATTGTTVNASPAATQSYTVTGTSAAGCNGSRFFTVTVNPLPAVAINPAAVAICSGASTALTASGANTYAWSPATGLSATTGANVTATPASTTTYTVSGTGANGCVNTSTSTVTVNSLPSVTVFPGATAICSGNSAVLTALGASTYTWSPATGLSATTGSSVTANPSATTTYTVTGTDANGCVGTATVTVTVNPLPNVAVNPAATAICVGANTTLTASGAGTYAWSPATGLSATTGANVAANPTTSTTYTVTGTSVAGCINTATTTVTVNPLPVISVNPPVPTLCSGSSVTLTAGGANTYAWSPATGLSATTGTTVTANPTSTNFYTITGTSAEGCVSTHTFILIVTNAVAATITPTDPLCFNSSDGSALVNVNSGSAPYSFLWSNGQTTNPATGLPAGNVNVTITDNVGCTGTASSTLTEPTAISSSVTPYVFPGGDNISCTGASDGSADLSVAGGTTPYTFLWSNGQTSEDIINVPAGNYSVTITDANNCTATNTVTLTEPLAMSVALNSPTFAGGFNISCTGYNDGAVNATITNGVAPLTYLWNNGATTQNITNGVAGNQNLTVTDINGCTVTSIIALTEPPGITSSVTSQTYNGGYSVSCNGATDGSVDLTVNNATGIVTYVWNNGATTEDLSNLPSGTYSVVVTDANGCTSSSSATLTQPAVLAGNLTVSSYNGNVNISCNGFTDGSITPSLSGGVLPYSYNWSSGQTSQNITGIAAGNYSVTITDANGCTVDLSATLTEPNPLTAGIFTGALTLGGYNITCNGAADGAIDLTVTDGTSPYSFLWSNGDTDEDQYGLTAGNYSVTVTDDNGCTASDNTTLTEPPAVTATIASFTDVLCNGGNDGSATVNAGGGSAPYTYLWETGQTTATVVNFVAGIHNVTVTDIMGCQEMESITISEPPLLTVSVSGSSVICIGQSTQVSATPVGGTAPYSYNWSASPADVSLTPTDQNPTVSPVVPTTYILSLIDANGCSLIADAVSVPVHPPLAVTLSYNGPTGVCPGFSTPINFVASGGNGTYSWTINSISGNYTSPYTATPATTGYYVFTANDNCGTPVATDSILVTVYPLPDVNFNADTLAGCEPFTVRFTDNTVATPAAYLWNFGDDNSSTSSSPVNTYYQEGIYDVQLIATTTDGCVDSTTITNMIEVFPLPTSDFTLSPTVENVLEAWISFTDQSSGAQSWHWDFGDDSTSTLVNPEHFYTDTGRYRIWLTVTSQEGCVDSVQREVRITPDFMIYIPNAFTPDENGLNDGFRVHGEGIKPEGFEFRIFTRWGEQVFSTFDVNGTWFGDHNGNGVPIESGVYVYTVLLKNIHNKVLSYKGHVVVLR